MAEFFKSDHRYRANAPYKAPEIQKVFRCVAVVPDPNDGRKQFAFGFFELGDGQFGPSGMGPKHWTDGWIDITGEESAR